MGPKLISLVCTGCKRSFSRKLRQYQYQSKISGEDYQVFCSQICRKKYLSKRSVEVKCDNCGKLHLKPVSEFKKDSKHFFCSRSCRTIFCNKQRKAEGFTLKGRTKIAKCINCQNAFDIKANASAKTFICDDCKLHDPSYRKVGDGFHKKHKTHLQKCLMCSNEFETIRAQYCKACLSEIQRKAGCASAAKRKDTKRSKNEILFAELCIKEFGNATANQAIFNGWDSDIQLYDYKIAIHWNGNWHYVFCGGRHSLEQVQARDKIKHDQIAKCGWENYIIEDRGKFKKAFVEEEFVKLKAYIKKKE